MGIRFYTNIISQFTFRGKPDGQYAPLFQPAVSRGPCVLVRRTVATAAVATSKVAGIQYKATGRQIGRRPARQDSTCNVTLRRVRKTIVALEKAISITHYGGPGSSVGIATGYGAGRSGDRIPVEARFSAPVQTGPGAHPDSCTMGTGSFSGVKSGRGVTLTPHPVLVPWS